jgi:hypothetical protein
MQAAGLQKLFLAVNSLNDSVLALGSEDTFNLVTFSTQAEAMHEKMLPANAANIKYTLKYLDKLTSKRDAGTNILAALDAALAFEPTVVVLITDGLPVTNDGSSIETNPQKILDAVRDLNRNNAVIYVVALEIDLKRSRGAKLLISLAEENSGKIKAIDSVLLYEIAEDEGLTDN